MAEPNVTQIPKEDLEAAQKCMVAAGLLGAKEGHAEVKTRAMVVGRQPEPSPAESPPAKLEIQNPQTMGMVIVQDNEKAIIKLIEGGMTGEGLKMRELSQEVAGEDLNTALSCSAPKAGRGR